MNPVDWRLASRSVMHVEVSLCNQSRRDSPRVTCPCVCCDTALCRNATLDPRPARRQHAKPYIIPSKISLHEDCECKVLPSKAIMRFEKGAEWTAEAKHLLWTLPVRCVLEGHGESEPRSVGALGRAL